MTHSYDTTARKSMGAGARLMCAAVLVASIAACSPIYRTHGYVPSDQELSLIEVGKDSRESVAVAIGRPSASGLLNDVGWFYVQSRWKTLGLRAPEELEREVVAVSFDAAGTVTNVERFGLEKGQIVPLSRRVTDSSIAGKSVLAQMFGNIGGIGAGNLIK